MSEKEAWKKLHDKIDKRGREMSETIIGGNGELKNAELKEDSKDPKIEKKDVHPPTDFKVAEIWIRDGKPKIEAPMAFWEDRVMAVGLLDICKDIVKTAQLEEKKPRIIPASGGIMSFVRNRLRK